MCGLFGVTHFNKDLELQNARESLHTLIHRGPDQWGEYMDERVYLGHRRLSILDLSDQGKQPMTDRDQQVVITVNGEIYNFRELRSELSGKYEFTSQSDSEVVLHGYREWGLDGLLERIEGMYAFTVYDREKRELYLARDRAGIKPLYYSRIQGRIVYGSELKSIRNFIGERNLDIDTTALYDYLTYLYIPATKTLYKNVLKLEPGHYLKVDLQTGSVEKTRYWELVVGQCGDSVDTAAEKIYSMVKESVDEQMVSDVPVGFFLSGGMDSSSLVAVASKLNRTISTFSIGFSVQSHDETHFADLVAGKYHTEHHKKILDAGKTVELFPNLKQWYDEPFADTSCFPTFLVSEHAKENVTVVLTGDGGDEIFGGYTWYEKFKQFTRYNLPVLSPLRKIFNPLRNLSPFLNAGIKKIEHPWLYDDLELYTRLKSGMLAYDKREYKKKWEIPDDYDDYWYFRKYYRPELDALTRLQYLDFHTYLPDDILTKVDRVSMAVSLECRVPLLSRKIIEYMFSLPAGIRYHGGELKGVLKEAFKNELPDTILNRGKKGFSIPYKNLENSAAVDENNRQKYILKHLFGEETNGRM